MSHLKNLITDVDENLAALFAIISARLMREGIPYLNSVFAAPSNKASSYVAVQRLNPNSSRTR